MCNGLSSCLYQKANYVCGDFLLLFGNEIYCFRRPEYGLKLMVLGEYGECFDDYFNGGCLK